MSYNNHTLNIQIISQNCFECHQRNNTQGKNFFNLIHIEAADPHLCLFYPGTKGRILKLRIITV